MAGRVSKIRYCVATELSRLQHFGRLSFCTFTFPPGVSLEESKRRVARLQRGPWRYIWAGVTVWEQHRSGRWHAHAVGIIKDRKWDGEWRGTGRGPRYFPGPSDIAWYRQLRKLTDRYGIGRTQIIPVREGTGDIAARYVAKYVTKATHNPPGQNNGRKRLRLVDWQLRRKWHRLAGMSRCTSTTFSWRVGYASVFRLAAAWVAASRLLLPTVDQAMSRAARRGTGLGWMWPCRALLNIETVARLMGITAPPPSGAARWCPGRKAAPLLPEHSLFSPPKVAPNKPALTSVTSGSPGPPSSGPPDTTTSTRRLYILKRV